MAKRIRTLANELANNGGVVYIANTFVFTFPIIYAPLENMLDDLCFVVYLL